MIKIRPMRADITIRIYITDWAKLHFKLAA